jgi:DNA processing protein
MNKAIRYKALQTRNKYRNPDYVLNITESVSFTPKELSRAHDYIQKLELSGIRYTYPGEDNYPMAFYQMIEPPLFLEYMGHPCWKTMDLISVVGSRDCHDLTSQWLNTHLVHFLKLDQLGLVSGGAKGVDMKSHMAALRAKRATVVVLPCGLNQMYPQDLKYIVTEIINGGGAIISEFEMDQKIHKSFFYFRNRLISALGRVCLVAQAGIKSGTMLTVHHALQNGRPVVTIPAHPGLSEFAGNVKLINEGAVSITDCLSLYDFWKAESWSRY